ncbi:ABC transporter permease [Pimelobacter simplex]|uniref:L-proline glycine betaine ABC transport system permease protein ProW n=2 Tax=Nocardioides simplex TaxID=2045 RepID=A0A0A1DIA4_NOCSI|nr:ABC transporter permease subunit [Pimelobacter simplex]AIY16989.1 L-proline glycine betaine ABC transport system permease protein ProW [Pimelobacter simplex]GEB12907.1 glycine/betaine ABC transporter permease [Pimelobacter simplex]SFM52449.1 osmoprotectant transport system permease protein [Pimelobacter simplex]
MTWLDTNRAYVLDMLVQHVRLAVPAIAISVLVAIVLGRIAWRWPRAGTVVLGIASLLYSVPALPLLIVIPVLLGIPLRSGLTLVVALAVYGTALLAGTAADAFRSVDPRVREAAEAMGYSRTGLFWKVDLPLAVPVLLSGIRVITVSTVSLVTIGALVGIPSLGNLLTDGFQRDIRAEIVVGVLGTMLLAIALDVLLVVAGALLTPWRERRPRRARATTASAVPAVEGAA